MLSIALAGCAGSIDPGDSPGETSSASAEPGNEPTETPTPTVSSSADPAPVLTTAGYGDLMLGKRVPSDTGLVTWKADMCDSRVGDDGGRWIPAVDFTGNDDDSYFVVRTADNSKRGAVSQILVYDPSIETKSGAHVGSTRDELQDLFPNLKKVRGEKAVSGLYSVSDNLGRVIFETMEHTVVDIIIQEPDVEPFGVQFTDVGGFCTG